MIPAFTKDATYGDLLPPAIEIARSGNKEMGEQYVQAYVKYLVENWDRTEEKAREIVMANIGYWAGYYDSETMKLVHQFYGAKHPIFGTSDPTPQEAFDAGAKLMEKTMKGEDDAD